MLTDSVKPLTCGVSGCGEHGTCNTVSGNCSCYKDEGWTGTFCNIPPVDTPCVKSDQAFRDAHGGGDKSCGNWGQFGVCNDDGTCSCGYVYPFFGSRCQNCSLSDAGCGKIEGASEVTGVLDPRSHTCSCRRIGWSGPQCREVDESIASGCKVDADCGWGAEYRLNNPASVCNKETGACICAKTNNNEPLYTGKFCQKLYPVRNGVCASDSDCGWKQTCSQEHVCVGGESNDDSQAQSLVDKLAAIPVSMFLTEEGLAQLATFMTLSHFGPAVLQKAMLAIKDMAISKVEAYMASSAAKTAAVIPEGLAAEMAADAMSKLGSEAVVRATEQGVMVKMGLELGSIVGSFANMLMMLGMVIDLLDPSGLNTQMHQEQIDMTMQAMIEYVNNSESIRDSGIVFPQRFYPSETVPFQAIVRGTDMVNKQLTYQREYMDRLTVNSNGQLIKPLTTSMNAMMTADSKLEDDKKKYKVTWSLSRGSNETFKMLLKYGWIIWVSVAVIAAVIVSAVVVLSLKKSKKKTGVATTKR